MTPKQNVRLNSTIVAVGMSFVGIQYARLMNHAFKQRESINFLADIINRDLSQITEFDAIALKDLGLLKEPK